jgi:hypothetical protein
MKKQVEVKMSRLEEERLAKMRSSQEKADKEATQKLNEVLLKTMKYYNNVCF